jgi:hypothetical protein
MTSVITGDIIRSRAQKTTTWMRPLKTALSRYGQETADWEIYRGDSFQLEVKSPEKVLEAAILIKASIKQINKMDVRMAIGIGKKTHRARKISQANGSAFVNSGECFESLGKKNLAIRSPWPEVDLEVNLLLDVALLVMNKWTTSSAEIVRICVERPDATQKVLARRLKISQSNISGRLRRAGFQEIMRIRDRFVTLIQNHL